MAYFVWLVSFRLIWLNPGCSGADKKMSCAATGKGNMSRVSLGL